VYQAHQRSKWDPLSPAHGRFGIDVPGGERQRRTVSLQARTSHGADAAVARVRALAAYTDFLTLWKDADPDIPILKQAKAEYAKLQ
jgi:hypothetical protein